MDNWQPAPPTPSDLGDREVPLLSNALTGREVALLVSGSIAAFKAPLIARLLRRHGADVTAYASASALNYVTAEALAWSCDRPVVTQLSAAAEHLSDTRPFDVYLLAPATYNTINKLAAGVADTLITSTLASSLG
ncbi:MAG: flavoprotein, partial [Gammaproteobacteria bacterium]